MYYTLGQVDFPSSIERDDSEFYGPMDFMVGSSVEILHKRFYFTTTYIISI